MLWTLSCPQTVQVTFLSAQGSNALPIINNIPRVQYRGEVLQHYSVLLLALGEPPLRLIEESVKVSQQWDLLLHTDGHVILHRVHGSEDQVKHTHRVTVKEERLGTRYQASTFSLVSTYSACEREHERAPARVGGPPFPPVASENGAQVVRFSSKCFYQLTHFIGPFLTIFISG